MNLLYCFKNNMMNFVRDDTFEKYQAYEKSKEELNTTHENMASNSNIHVILIGNKEMIVNRIVQTLSDLIDSNNLEHFIVVSYGLSTKLLYQVLPLKTEVIAPISNIVSWKCHECIDFATRDEIINSIKTKSICKNNPEFKFLEKYSNIFVYD